MTGVSPRSIGADTVRAILAQKPGQLILASKSGSKLQEVVKSLEIPEDTTVRLLELDLGSLEAVRKAEAHKRADLSFLDDSDLTYDNAKAYEKWTAYANSKLCNIALSVGLVQHFGKKNLRSFVVHPGVILTTAQPGVYRRRTSLTKVEQSHDVFDKYCNSC